MNAIDIVVLFLMKLLLAETTEGVQTPTDNVMQVYGSYRMSLTGRKMYLVSQNKLNNAHFFVNNKPLEHIERGTYLGCNLNNKWDHIEGIERQ